MTEKKITNPQKSKLEKSQCRNRKGKYIIKKYLNKQQRANSFRSKTSQWWN